MKKQTAVEWFYENLKNYKTLDLNDRIIQDLFKKAQQMEYGQIEGAIQAGWDMNHAQNIYKHIAHEYYSETFGGES